MSFSYRAWAWVFATYLLTMHLFLHSRPLCLAAAAPSCLDILRTRYHIERVPFGRGLEGQSYRATASDHSATGYRAIKWKPLDKRGYTSVKATALEYRPETEAVILSQLPPHPNIVSYYEHVVGDWDICLVEEYIDGITLDRLTGGDIPISSVHMVALLHHMVLAMGHLHAQGVAHNDLCTGNLMISSEGVLKIIDFGLAGWGSPETDHKSIATLIPLLYGPAFVTVPNLCRLYRSPFALLEEQSAAGDLLGLFEQVDYDEFPFRVFSLPTDTAEYERGYFVTEKFAEEPDELPVDISLISRSSLGDGEFRATSAVLAAESCEGHLELPLAMITRQRFHWVIFLASGDSQPVGQINEVRVALDAINHVKGALSCLHARGLSFCSPHLACSIGASLRLNRRLGIFQLRSHAMALATSQEELIPRIARDLSALAGFIRRLAAKVEDRAIIKKVLSSLEEAIKDQNWAFLSQTN